MTAQPFDPRQGLTAARRDFLRHCGSSVGGLALGRMGLGGLFASLVPNLARAQASATMPRPDGTPGKRPHFPARAGRVVNLFMAGAPSQLDLFDYKPALARLEGQPLPPSVIAGQRYAFIRPDAAVLGPRFAFRRHGQSGAELSEVLPHLASIVDDVCFVKSMRTDQFNHAPAQILRSTGFQQPGRPSLGAWALFGLGAEARDLPGYVVMSTGAGISGGAANWSSGFLPTSYTGCRLRNQGDPILATTNPPGVDARLQRESFDVLRLLNQRRSTSEGDPEIATRMAAYDMAERLQESAPELMNLRSESAETLALYGCDPDQPSFARACLLARRMLERGVRFVDIFHEGWDAHSDVAGTLKNLCGNTDRAAAALVIDLKRRGLLDDTLVVWGGEFGRTPMVETNPTLGRALGRDHHPSAFTIWMAGGGARAGYTHGATDELGFHVADDPVHVHDLQATILHLLGFDHERLTFRHAGRDYRLTDVFGQVVRALLA